MYSALSFNINCARECSPGGFAYEHFSAFGIKKRLPNILQRAQQLDTDLVSYCEVSDWAKEELLVGLPKAGYTVLTGAYAPNQKPPNTTFHFVIGYKPSAFELIKSYMFWFTEHPLTPHTPESRGQDTLLKSLGEGFEKGSLISIFKTSTGTLIHSMNHLGLRLPYQNACYEMLYKHLDELNDTLYGPKVFIVQGDLNTLPSVNLEEVASKLSSQSLKMRLIPNQTLTFVAYPYDLGLKLSYKRDELKEKAKGLTSLEAIKLYSEAVVEFYKGPLVSILDHSFVGGDVQAFEQTVDTEGIDMTNLTNEFLKQAITGEPFTLSDHFGLVLKWD